MNIEFNEFDTKEFKKHYKQALKYLETKYGHEVFNLFQKLSEDKELANHIIFCNDVLRIQPTYLFAIIFKDYLEIIIEKEKASDYVDLVIKRDDLDYEAKYKLLEGWRSRSIGALFGYYFKFMMHTDEDNTRNTDKKNTGIYDSVQARYCPENCICNKAAYFVPKKSIGHKYWNADILKSYEEFKKNNNE